MLMLTIFENDSDTVVDGNITVVFVMMMMMMVVVTIELLMEMIMMVLEVVMVIQCSSSLHWLKSH